MKIFKFHYNYLFSKNLLIISTILIFVILFLYTNIVLNLDEYNSDIENRNIFFHEGKFYTRFFLVFLSVFMFSNCMVRKNDFSIVLLLPLNISRIKYLITKIILLCSYLFIVILILLDVYIIIMNNNFYITIAIKDVLIAFSGIYLETIIYGIISMFIMIKIDNLFSVVITFVIYIALSSIELDNSIVSSIIKFFIPYNLDSIMSLIRGLGSIFFWAILCSYNYNKKDLNYS